MLLLPHAHEGQGPDHASARPERFLQLAADINMRIANCTTAAQYFHLLRRQAALLHVDPLPLVVLTPKSLLRHPLVAVDAARARRRPLPDGARRSETPQARAGDVRRVLVCCSGKVYVDLVGERAARGAHATSRSAGVEQLYPVPMRDLRAVLDAYPHAEEIVWVQEEPENMGAWDFIRPHLVEVVGRPDRPPRRAAAQREPGRRLGGAARAAISRRSSSRRSTDVARPPRADGSRRRPQGAVRSTVN